MARNPPLKKHVAIAHLIANKVRAASSRRTENRRANEFNAIAGIDHAKDSKRRRKLAQKFPIELHKKVLESLKPKLYKPRRGKPQPATVTTWEGLVELRRRRHADKKELWHEDDVIEIGRKPCQLWYVPPSEERKPKRVLLDRDAIADEEDW